MPVEVRPIDEIERALRGAAPAGALPCALAMEIAATHQQTPQAVREVADALGIRLSACQLGLFGYEPFGAKQYSHHAASVPPDLAMVVRDALDGDRLPCATAWRIADARGLPRLVIGSVAETLGCRVSRCQLGCFR